MGFLRRGYGVSRGSGRSGPTLGYAGLALGLTLLVAVPLAADDDEYPHGEFEGDCETCHSDDGFRPARISEEFEAEHPFPRKGAHALDDCRACHRSLDFTKASPACVDCHLDPHRGEMGTDCSRCHVPRTFIDRTRMQRSHQSTRFPLRGSHRALDCEDCHTLQPPGALRWVNTPVECVECHEDAFPAGHQSAGFPRDCDFCHVPTVWQAGRFDHAGIVDGCVACHRQDYDATVDPSHTGAGFPTTCEDCHTPTNWDNADFDHSANFPIDSGTHRGRWGSCSTCHINQSNFSQFSCFGCHPHSDEDRTRQDHEGEPGFNYDSNACLSCHRNGEA